MTGRGLCTHVAIGLLILSTLSVTSCRRLNVGADLEDIEWVIVACHAEGFLQQWVAKLTPTSDRTLIARLMASINVAREVGPTSETAGDGFIVFKLKPAGIRAFNVVPWGGDREVEIRPAYLSSDLGRLLRRIGNDRVGWATGDSFPEFQVNEIRVHEAGRPMRSFDPGSGSYRPLADAAAEVVQAFDPRWCEPNYEHGEPALSSRHQRVPMFIFLLEKPIQLSKLVVCRAEGDPLVARVKYVAFSSSQFAIYAQTSESGQLTDVYLGFMPTDPAGESYTWSLRDAYMAPTTMGKPDGYEAFKRLLQTYRDRAGLLP